MIDFYKIILLNWLLFSANKEARQKSIKSLSVEKRIEALTDEIPEDNNQK